MSKAEARFREAFERLKKGIPEKLPKGSEVSQNNVAREAGVDPSAIRKSRYKALVEDIQVWLESFEKPAGTQSKRQLASQKRAKRLSLSDEITKLKAQRDDLASKLVSAEARIVSLTNDNDQLRSRLPPVNVVPLRSDRGK